MVERHYPARLTTLITCIALGLSACGSPEPKADVTKSASSSAELEAQLRKQAKAMQRTILEGAAAGGATGAGLGFTLGGGDKDSTKSGFKIGLGAGVAAGSYVAFIQRKYFRKERRLEAIKSDLDKNAVEMQTTINVMRGVLAVQQAELADLKLRATAGQASEDDLSAELTEANANLAEMQKAIDGATKRQSEFGEARRLTLVKGGTSEIDPDLAALSEQIAAMKAIATDLSVEL